MTVAFPLLIFRFITEGRGARDGVFDCLDKPSSSGIDIVSCSKGEYPGSILLFFTGRSRVAEGVIEGGLLSSIWYGLAPNELRLP